MPIVNPPKITSFWLITLLLRVMTKVRRFLKTLLVIVPVFIIHASPQFTIVFPVNAPELSPDIVNLSNLLLTS